jgi:exosortase/archaeosortase family protein
MTAQHLQDSLAPDRNPTAFTTGMRTPWAHVGTMRLTGPRAALVGALVLAVLLPLTTVAPAFWRTAFCLPAARLAALFLNAPCVPAPDGYLLAEPSLPVRVTLACSAASFFALLTALIIGTARGSVLRRPLRLAAGAMALAYGVTLLANTTRIVLGWMAGRCSRAWLPESFWPGVHMGVGVFVFLTFLIAAYALATWRYAHERQS